ncbi:MAG: DUF3047 domain-containing protein [Xenococcus sp. MO_188.B8]|nr:DUF3047 domain-containing protein [Xenococcus sp. MO_188.B8]
MCLDLTNSIKNKYLKISKHLSSLLLALSLWTPMTANAQENELKPITFGDQATEYSIHKEGQKIIIEAEGQDSASGLFVPNPKICLENNQLSWAWRVDQIQDTADITVEEKEDFAASLLIIFGKPGVFSQPKVLIYAFANTDLPQGSIVSSPRAPDNFRTIVLENQESPLMSWLQYERNIIEDYELVYGEMPEKMLHTIGIFTDNDQTQEPVKASYNLQSCNLSAQGH